MNGDLLGVRVIPPVVEFIKYKAGFPARLEVSIQNISAKSKWIRFHPITSNDHFSTELLPPHQHTSPGLKETAVVVFKGKPVPVGGDGVLTTTLHAAVDDDILEIPVAAFPVKPLVRVKGDLEFGNVLAGGRILHRTVILWNVGGADAVFQIVPPSRSSGCSVGVTPAAGCIAPEEELKIRFEVLTNVAKNIDENVVVNLQGLKKSISIPVRIDVVKRDFGVMNSDGEKPIRILDFGSVFHGSDAVEKAYLYNNSPEAFSFVCVLNDAALGQEAGTDLSRPVADVLATPPTAGPENAAADGAVKKALLKRVVHVFPPDGTIGPYQKMPLVFLFMPRPKPRPISGFNALDAANEHRQDYAIFLRIEIVESSPGFEAKHHDSFVEVALKGTSLPVGFQVSTPDGGSTLDFGPCRDHEQTQTLCKFHNGSPYLPLTYKVRNVAHFNVIPQSGKIVQRGFQDVQIAFVPNQYGKFSPQLLVDVMGPVVEVESLIKLTQPFFSWAEPKITYKPIHTHAMTLNGTCLSTTTFPPAKFNPGIVPLIANETGIRVEAKIGGRDAPEVNNGEGPRQAVLQAKKTKAHANQAELEETKTESPKAKLAFPNDLARSVRPGCRDGEQYRTLFTKTKRHTYVDFDYQFTKEEREAIQRHKEIYKKYVEDLRDKRIAIENRGKYEKYLTPVDVGLTPGQGMRPPQPTLDDLVRDLGPVFVSKLRQFCRGCSKEVSARILGPQLPELLSLRELTDAEASILGKDGDSHDAVSGLSTAPLTTPTTAMTTIAPPPTTTTSTKGASGLRAVPVTLHEIRDCGATLTPSQLHRVVVGPPIVDFGKTCLASSATRELKISNLLDIHVHLEISIDCRELRQSSPLALVLPPNCSTNVPLVFDSNTKGVFHRPIKYRINRVHSFHFLVRAEVVPVSLELTPSELVVAPMPGLAVDAGSRGVVSLRNPYNSAANFKWSPILGEEGTAFSVRPAAGSVEPFSSVVCEVVFHPSFSAPEVGEFSLSIVGAGRETEEQPHSAQLRLRCVARTGPLPQNWPLESGDAKPKSGKNVNLSANLSLKSPSLTSEAGTVGGDDDDEDDDDDDDNDFDVVENSDEDDDRIFPLHRCKACLQIVDPDSPILHVCDSILDLHVALLSAFPGDQYDGNDNRKLNRNAKGKGKVKFRDRVDEDRNAERVKKRIFSIRANSDDVVKLSSKEAESEKDVDLKRVVSSKEKFQRKRDMKNNREDNVNNSDAELKIDNKVTEANVNDNAAGVDDVADSQSVSASNLNVSCSQGNPNRRRFWQKAPLRTKCLPRRAEIAKSRIRARSWDCLKKERMGEEEMGEAPKRKKRAGAHVEFVDRRINFANIPVNLTSVQTALLKNGGAFHAYFKIVNPTPISGLLVSPRMGMVPAGGTTEIQVQFKPSSKSKFDTKFDVLVRGVKTPINMRIGGNVGSPEMEIVLPTKGRKSASATPKAPVLQFGGVDCGSTHSMPFTLINNAETKALVEFDLVKYRDFEVQFSDLNSSLEPKFEPNLDINVYRLRMSPKEALEGKLVFKPTEVAAYNFFLPIKVNEVPPPAPLPPNKVMETPTPAELRQMMAESLDFGLSGLNVRVDAVACRRPLQISPERVTFDLSSAHYELVKGSGMGEIKELHIKNMVTHTVTFSLDLGADDQVTPSPLKTGIFRFIRADGTPFLGFEKDTLVGATLAPGQSYSIKITFCPEFPGKFYCKVPLYIRSDPNAKSKDRPFTFIDISGIQRRPSISFDPRALHLQPVPLATGVVSHFDIIATGYNAKSELRFHLPIVKALDDSIVDVFGVHFPRGRRVDICGEEAHLQGRPGPCVIPVVVKFLAEKPVSFTGVIVFVDLYDREYVLPVSVTADNSLLSCYSFLAQHQSDYKVVCEQGATLRGYSTGVSGAEDCSKERTAESATTTPTSTVLGEAVLVPCRNSHSAEDSRRSTTATLTSFSEPASPETKDTEKSREVETRVPTRKEAAEYDIASRSLGSALFPDDDSEESLFQSEVLLAVQRWISSQGNLSIPPQPLTVPYSLRASSSGRRLLEERGTKKKTDSAPNLAFQTIYDIVSNLVGKPMPGIPKDKAYSANYEEMVKELHWRNSTLLVFLRKQGGTVCSIKPEYLMEPEDYFCWMKMMKENGQATDQQILPVHLFESVSKRAWTDLLLQMIKTLVLSRVTPKTLAALSASVVTALGVPEMPTLNPDPFCSNIYNVGERIVLAWLNHHYEHLRVNLWAEAQQGPPSSRWVVNFDYDLLDGLVLGAAIGAYLPFLKDSHLKLMYTHPKTAEQCLHNALKVVNMLRVVGIDYDVQAIDITDPNPVALLLLCTYLYQVLPNYLPKAVVTISGVLHRSMKSVVKVANPVAKIIDYEGKFHGDDAHLFSLGKSASFSIASKGAALVPIDFRSRSLRPATTTLVLAGVRTGSAVGSPSVFKIRTEVTGIEPADTVVKCSSPCYEPYVHHLWVTNPFDSVGDFKVILLEMPEIPEPEPAKRPGGAAGKKKVEEPMPMDPALHMRSFFCRVGVIRLLPKVKTEVDITFIPFAIGKKKCSVVFSSGAVGDFVYSIEATGTAPLASPVPSAVPNEDAVVHTTTGDGVIDPAFGPESKEPQRVMYWQCKEEAMIQKQLPIPLTNVARDRALIAANQQLMSPKEIERRSLTGTLDAAAAAASRLPELFVKQGLLPSDQIGLAAPESAKGQTFKVSLSSTMFYSAAKTVYVPSSAEVRVKTFPGVNLADDTVDLPIKVIPKGIGVYPCIITLTALGDIRVFHVETSVNPKGTTTELQFTCRLQQQIVQDIPVVNNTKHDWRFHCSISGGNATGTPAFIAPPFLIAKSQQTTLYSVLFKPQVLGECKAELKLTNEVDGVTHVYNLTGKGNPPGALETISIVCEARSKYTQTLTVPNTSKSSLVFRPQCNLPFVVGSQEIFISPLSKLNYIITLHPLNRGEYRGVLAFIPTHQSDEDEESSSVISVVTVPDLQGYRVWFNIQVTVTPPKPEKVLEVTCACQKASEMEIAILNPTTHPVNFVVIFEGGAGVLLGEPSFGVASGQKVDYKLVYSPVVVGTTRASVIFQSQEMGEMWYDLILKATPPAPTTLPHMEAPLGMQARQTLVLNNPTEAELELLPTCSNPANFTLDLMTPEVVIPPHSTFEVGILFKPTNLGQMNHLARISFANTSIGDWVYIASGTGLLPLESPVQEMTTGLGMSTQLLIKFENPTTFKLVVDIELFDFAKTDGRSKEMDASGSLIKTPSKVSKVSSRAERLAAFKIHMAHLTDLHLEPGQSVLIPVVFSPELMLRSAAKVVVTVRREDGRNWKYTPPSDEQSLSSFSRSKSGGIRTIDWVYPIKGVPVMSPTEAHKAPKIQCKAREEIQARLEVRLGTKIPKLKDNDDPPVTLRPPTPDGEAPATPDGAELEPSGDLVNHFEHHFEFDNDDIASVMERMVDAKLIRGYELGPESGCIQLVLDVIFHPGKALSHSGMLVVECLHTGGVWTFPVFFKAGEPDLDDIIQIESKGIDVPSSVSFCFYSADEEPEPFKAYFSRGGASLAFVVSPSEGILESEADGGTEIQIDFATKQYGKKYETLLTVETKYQSWRYQVEGVMPKYSKPDGRSLDSGLKLPPIDGRTGSEGGSGGEGRTAAKTEDLGNFLSQSESRPFAASVPSRPRGPQRRRRNFIRENLMMISTAPSSTFKGAPLVLRSNCKNCKET